MNALSDFSWCFIGSQIPCWEFVKKVLLDDCYPREVIPASLEWQGGMTFPAYTTGVDSREQVFMFIAKPKP